MRLSCHFHQLNNLSSSTCLDERLILIGNLPWGLSCRRWVCRRCASAARWSRGRPRRCATRQACHEPTSFHAFYRGSTGNDCEIEDGRLELWSLMHCIDNWQMMDRWIDGRLHEWLIDGWMDEMANRNTNYEKTEVEGWKSKRIQVWKEDARGETRKYYRSNYGDNPDLGARRLRRARNRGFGTAGVTSASRSDATWNPT